MRWEYLVTPVYTSVGSMAQPPSQGMFNRLGADGWELITVDVFGVAYFKRPLTEAPDLATRGFGT